MKGHAPLLLSILVIVTLLATPSAGQEDQESKTGTIDETGYCTNPDDDPGRAIWEEVYEFEDFHVLEVEVTLTWTDDEGSRSNPDEFELQVQDGAGSSDTDAGGSGALAVTVAGEELNSTWTVRVECTAAGMTPVGPIGIIGTPDPGNTWSLTLTYTYVEVPAEPPPDHGPPPHMRKLLESPIFKLHVALMITSTVMFLLVGVLAGVRLGLKDRWEGTADRVKAYLVGPKAYRIMAVHVWMVFFIASVPIGMYISGRAYGWENAWTSFPALWNPWFYDITNADHVSFVVLTLWIIPLWLNRADIVESRPHAWLLGRVPYFRKLAAKAPKPRLTERELAILYFFLGLMVFLVFMVQPHGN